jgi:cation:H+ antiporter
MLYNSLAILAGFALLIWSADRFICGAAAVAKNFKISPLVIGIVIVGFGTSAPEMLVSVIASLDGSPSLAVGNALGSNITNIALVLGVSALIKPLSVHSRILKKELPLLLVAMILALLLVLDDDLGRVDGMILLGALFAIMWWLAHEALHNRVPDSMQIEFEHELPPAMPMPRALFWLAVGLVVLLASSKLLVWGAVNIAISFGVSELVIGLTVVAIGTSLPELAATAMSALKNEHDIAIGNIVGSNLFNILAVFGIPGLLAPGPLDPEVLNRDFPVVFGLTIALVIMASGLRKAGRINRIGAGILLLSFFAYQALLYYSVHGAAT